MDPNRFTEKMQEAIRGAQNKAIRYGNQQVDVEHLLANLLEQEGGLAPSILNKANVPVDAVKSRLEQELNKLPKVATPAGAPADQVYITGRLQKLLTEAEDEASGSKTTLSRWSMSCSPSPAIAAPPAACSRTSALPASA